MKLLSLEPESSASANSAMPAYPTGTGRWTSLPCVPLKDARKGWCEERESNPYGVNHTPLKRARLPVPPPSHCSVRRSHFIGTIRFPYATDRLYTISGHLSRGFAKVSVTFLVKRSEKLNSTSKGSKWK